jgi:hypothetical protein
MYIGKIPTVGNFQICDTITVVDAQAAYTMQVATVDVSPESANHMIVSLNGVIQKPTDAYTVSGSTITFASALETGDVIDFIQILGNVLDLGVPSDNTVTTAKLADSSVSLAKLTATGTKDATTFLRGDNTFDTPPLGGITMADQWRLTADLTDTATPISSNLERVDTDSPGFIGSAMTESSGIFTFPSTGMYLITFGFSQQIIGTADYATGKIQVTTDNSSYSDAGLFYTSSADTSTALNSGYTNFIFDVTNTTTHKTRFTVTQADAANKIRGNTGYSITSMTFIRLGDT